MTRGAPPSRRAVLLTAGGLAAAGGGFGAGFGVARATQPGSGSGQAGEQGLRVPVPGEDLMYEHGLLVRILLIYRHLGALAAAAQPMPAVPLHDSALIVHDYIETFHEGLEEAYVFPPLKAGPLGDTVSTLLLQHARGRQITQLLLADSGGNGPVPAARASRAAQAMAAFVRMYEPHEAREDTVVYPAFRSLLSPARITELGERFAQLERDQFGSSGLSGMVDRVAAIEQSLGIYDLGQFTAPNITPPAG